MAHQNKPVSIVIQDTNGQQQILQVMQTASTTGRPLTSASVKTIVKEVTGQETSAIISGQSFATPVMPKLAPGQKIITVNNPKLHIVNSPATKSANGKPLVRLSQLGQLKLIAAPGTSISGRNLTAMLAPSTSVAPSTSASATVVAPVAASTSTYVSTNGQMISESPPVSSRSSHHPSATPRSSKGSHSGNQQHQTAQYNYGKKTSPAAAGQIHTPASRRRKTDKIGRGLRHFSMKVCEKVKEKGTTSYNEVADELVAEETQSHPGVDPASYDQKNIRRRVYDALNVLMAMNIISKEKKEIRWHGLPTSSVQECDDLEKENEKTRQRIETKQQELKDLILQHVAFKSLVTRNQEYEARGLVPNPSSAVQLPFILVNTDRMTHIDCSISNDKSEFSFKFDDRFEIYDDLQVLKRMGLLLGLEKGKCTVEDICKIKSMVPETLAKYIDVYGLGIENETEDMDMASAYTGQDYDDSSVQDATCASSYQDNNSELNEDDLNSDDGGQDA